MSYFKKAKLAPPFLFPAPGAEFPDNISSFRFPCPRHFTTTQTPPLRGGMSHTIPPGPGQGVHSTSPFVLLKNCHPRAFLCHYSNC